MKSTKAKSRETSQKTDKEKLVDSLLESLHYGKQPGKWGLLFRRNKRVKIKEDTAIVDQICEIFKVPDRKNLRNYLIEKVDFSELFAKLLKLAEPFSNMMLEIYQFLDEQRKTARAPEHLIIGESVRDSISFDLETFPELYQPVIQRIEGYLRRYSLHNILNNNISPLFWTEYLLGCGHCIDKRYRKTEACLNCDDALRRRFGNVFQQFEKMVAVIPEEVKNQNQMPYASLCRYYEEAKEQYRTGNHWSGECRGYEHWNAILEQIEWRFDLIAEKQPGTYDVEVLQRFFELPFWKERNRLYEIWTLTHFLHLLRGVTFDLNIREGQWHLTYSDAKEPVAHVHGQGFEIKIYYQYKLKTGLKMFPSEPIEPEMLFVYFGPDNKAKNLALIECKERLDYDVREVMKLAAFYRAQANTELNIFCNYYGYSPRQGYQTSGDEPLVVLSDQFWPNSPLVDRVDRDFLAFMKKRLGDFLQAVLIDISGSMRGKDIEAVYQKLNRHLSQLPGSKSLGGIFSNQVELSEYEELVEKLRHSPNIGGGTVLSTSLDSLRNELLKKHGELAAINFYVITDIDFSSEDWQWLRQVDSDTNYNITFVAQSAWVGRLSRQRLEELKRIKLMFL